MAEALLDNVVLTEPILCSGGEPQPGDMARIFLDQDANPGFPEYIDGVIQFPLEKSSAIVGNCISPVYLYSFIYDTADLLGLSVKLRAGDILTIECLPKTEVVGQAIDAEVIRATAAENALQASFTSGIQAVQTSVTTERNRALAVEAALDTAIEAVVVGKYGSLRSYVVNDTLRANVRPASGTLTTKWASPGPLYNYGQWVADGCYIVMGLAEVGDFSDAWEILQTYGHSQHPITGFIPRYTRPDGQSINADNASTSQWPMIAHAANYLFSKNANLTKLALIYQIAKKNYAWWEAQRQDATGLAFWGNEYAPNESYSRFLGMAEGAMDKWGFANDAAFTATSVFPGGGRGHEHCCPVLNSLLVMESDALAAMATALGLGSEISTWLNKSIARKNAINAYMWDEEQGWYQRVLRSDKALPRTAVESIAGTSLVVTNTGNSYTIIPHGELIVFANGQLAQAAKNPNRPDGNWQINPPGDTASSRTITLMSTPVGVTAGMTITGRPFAYFKGFHDAALLLHAQVVPKVGLRVSRMMASVYKIFDGTEPDQFSTTFFSNAYRGFGFAKMGWTRWHIELQNATAGVTTVTVGTTSALNLVYRDIGYDEYALHTNIPKLRDYIFYDREMEKSRRNRPTIGKIYFQRYLSGDPVLQFKDYRTVISEGQTLPQTVPFVAPSGLDVPIMSTGGEFQGDDVVGSINFTFTGMMYILGFSATTYPVGYVFDSPHGFITSSRLGANAFFRPPSDTTYYPALADQDDRYWQPGIWAHFQYHFYKGLLNYSYEAEADKHAEKFLNSWNGVFQDSGDVPEYITPVGKGAGSTKYGWSGAALLMVLNESGLK